jgi:hypothetical protein
MNLDLYHGQIGEGNLVRLVERALPFIRKIQIAEVPGLAPRLRNEDRRHDHGVAPAITTGCGVVGSELTSSFSGPRQDAAPAPEDGGPAGPASTGRGEGHSSPDHGLPPRRLISSSFVMPCRARKLAARSYSTGSGSTRSASSATSGSPAIRSM